ncbi:MAG: hypothetical protein [Bacteriophage sp.]|nr:MAG: hypothetical protein [Bacteriophage sp.]
MSGVRRKKLFVDAYIGLSHLPWFCGMNQMTLKDIGDGVRLMYLSNRFFTGLTPGILEGSPMHREFLDNRVDAIMKVDKFINRMISQPK